MKTLLHSFALCALLLAAAGCPKRVDSNVAGTDDEQMDQLSARLEELRARVQAQEPQCKDWCSMSGEVSHLSQKVCDLSTKNPERSDMQQKCVASQEERARFNDGCAPCR